MYRCCGGLVAGVVVSIWTSETIIVVRVLDCSDRCYRWLVFCVVVVMLEKVEYADVLVDVGYVVVVVVVGVVVVVAGFEIVDCD